VPDAQPYFFAKILFIKVFEEMKEGVKKLRSQLTDKAKKKPFNIFLTKM
jgi:hypothetical protein